MKAFAKNSYFLVLFIIFGCENDHQVSFEIGRDTVRIDETFKMVNKSKNVENFVWKFGNGDQKKCSNKICYYEYETAGKYQIELSGKDEDGSNLGKINKPIVVKGYSEIRIESNLTFKEDGTAKYNFDVKNVGNQAYVNGDDRSYFLIGVVKTDRRGPGEADKRLLWDVTHQYSYPKLQPDQKKSYKGSFDICKSDYVFNGLEDQVSYSIFIDWISNAKGYNSPISEEGVILELEFECE